MTRKLFYRLANQLWGLNYTYLEAYNKLKSWNATNRHLRYLPLMYDAWDNGFDWDFENTPEIITDSDYPPVEA